MWCLSSLCSSVTICYHLCHLCDLWTSGPYGIVQCEAVYCTVKPCCEAILWSDDVLLSFFWLYWLYFCVDCASAWYNIRWIFDNLYRNAILSSVLLILLSFGLLCISSSSWSLAGACYNVLSSLYTVYLFAFHLFHVLLYVLIFLCITIYMCPSMCLHVHTYVYMCPHVFSFFWHLYVVYYATMYYF